MKKFVLLSVCFCSVLLGACKQQKETQTQSDEEPLVRVITPSFYGMYTGKLPIGVNEGVNTNLLLLRDSTYRLRIMCYDSGGLEYVEHGKIVFDDDVITLIDDDGHRPKYFKLSESSVSLLDQNKKIVKGDMASSYLLETDTTKKHKQSS